MQIGVEQNCGKRKQQHSVSALHELQHCLVIGRAVVRRKYLANHNAEVQFPARTNQEKAN